VYRDRLWQGADMVGLGVASFGHLNGVHVQNLDTWEAYVAALDRDELPLGRAYTPTAEERLVREFVLQLKRGFVEPAWFREKHGVDVLERFRSPLTKLQEERYLSRLDPQRVVLSREGLLRVDVLLRRFFLPEHVGIRYT
jgi:oxygen-independent coproporphyrinogen-3 oxidase